ncbi:capsid cement protein [Paracidovorax valerianellae]|uniref:DUF2190 domain-containing protein n=1 Tax=Paracidovorax valerianellae TaxID=187868 RepID=A0A1G7EK48_9BURK|nr:capsid cement protein [Paracidovorax valerianellae]MDA8446379.1 DUF2190 family protein [Paracidovorax valerianellae]SDE63785.1 hypothetical protein SAMN05192589_12346 [Paracidovorax valerianellae]
MASQNNTGRQFDKQHAVTVVATAALAAYRFFAYDGGYPTAAGGPKDVQGVSETAAEVGDAFSGVTSYSYLVEAGEAIAFGALVKPDLVGKAVAGSAADHCGRALGAATQAGQLIEVQLYKHVHA